jgi:hypothetical protein
MNECSTNQKQHFTGCASLAAIGVKLSQLKLFDPIRTTAQIGRKTIKHTPADKLYDALISPACWQEPTGWSKSLLVCEPIPRSARGRYRNQLQRRQAGVESNLPQQEARFSRSFDASGSVVAIVLNQEACLARSFLRSSFVQAQKSSSV